MRSTSLVFGITLLTLAAVGCSSSDSPGMTGTGGSGSGGSGGGGNGAGGTGTAPDTCPPGLTACGDQCIDIANLRIDIVRSRDTRRAQLRQLRLPR